MAIYQKHKGGIWYYSVYLRGREKRLRGSCGTTNRAEALLVEQTLRVAAQRETPKARILRIIEALYGEEKPAADVPLGAICFEVARVRKMQNRIQADSTRRISELRIRAFAEWTKSEWPMAKGVRDVDRVCAQAYAASLVKSGLASKTVRNTLGVLVTAWNDLRRAHDGLVNPWPLAMPAPGDEGRGEAFTPEEAARIFRAGDADGHGWGLAARLAACTGLRMGDVLMLQGEDIVDGVIVTVPHKTKRWKIRVCLPLPPEVAALIPQGGGYILPDLAQSYRPGYPLRYPFADILKAAGVDADKYTFHSFRHYFRTRLAAAGVSDETAMRLGGWTQRDTAARYDHDDHREELAAAIQAAWTGK